MSDSVPIIWKEKIAKGCFILHSFLISESKKHISTTLGTSADEARALPPGGQQAIDHDGVAHSFELEINTGNSRRAAWPGTWLVLVMINNMSRGLVLPTASSIFLNPSLNFFGRDGGSG